VTRAAALRDRIVARIDDTGFAAHGLHVRRGTEVAERRWTPDVREEIHSVSKCLCTLAAGFAVDEGLVGFDEPASVIAPDLAAGSRTTLRELLSMTSGIDLPWSETMMTDWPDLAAEFLGRPSRGRIFQYSNASTYAAMALLAQRVGDVAAFLEPRLFAPLGLSDVEWRRCPRGRILAGEGVALRTEEMSRLGALLRDHGMWGGRPVARREWADAVHTARVDTGSEADGYRRYALGAWEGPGPAWRLHGAHGQLVIVVADTVVTISAEDHFGADAIAAFVAGTAAS
jgi:CubicO group peptidase (beta-lactamase class C family)